MSHELLQESVGWLASLVLLLTTLKQVHQQWRAPSVEGVSHWLFIGQILASTCFVVYSWMLRNWVFVFTNGFMLVIALVGAWIYQRKS